MLILAGLTPGLESVRRFIYVGRGTLMPVAPPEHLVVSGFYRYVRNPMYVGVMVALTGEAILFWNRGNRDRSRTGLSRFQSRYSPSRGAFAHPPPS